MRLTGKCVLAVGLIIIAITFVRFDQQTQAMAGPRSIIYDSRFVSAMTNMSHLTPSGADLVVSSNGAIMTYFTGHTAVVPWGVTSEQGLIDYMYSRGYMFLAAFENKSDVPELKSLFTPKGMKSLETAFVKLGEYHTDFYVIILYQLKVT
jgi:hypothetical protein